MWVQKVICGYSRSPNARERSCEERRPEYQSFIITQKNDDYRLNSHHVNDLLQVTSRKIIDMHEHRCDVRTTVQDRLLLRRLADDVGVAGSVMDMQDTR